MEWISSLLGFMCPFCRKPQGNCRYACHACAGELVQMKLTKGLTIDLDGRTVVALGLYEDWLKSVVLMNKQSPQGVVIQALARELRDKMPRQWQALPLAWIPGRALSSIHLVECLARELNRLGQPLTMRPCLRRKLIHRKPQKALDTVERRSRDMSQIYATSPGARPGTSVLLLDDILTTGSTIRGVTKLLEQKLGLHVQGALSLAYTPSYSDSKARKVTKTSGSLTMEP